MFQKLSRRQRAFESIVQSSEMNSELMDRYRTILSREFTSSDEEIEDNAADADERSSGGAVADESQLIRVHTLTWQSEQVSELKSHLDDIYYKRFASDKQRASLSRTLRDGLTMSKRAKPAAAPSWTIK